MSFIADQQTLSDLNLLSKFKSDSILSFFNRVQTSGGQKLLEELFRNPLTDAEQINQRSGIFQYVQSLSLSFPFQAGDIDEMENFLEAKDGGSILVTGFGILKKQLLGTVISDPHYEQLLNQLKCTMRVLAAMKVFSNKIKPGGGLLFDEQLQKVMALVHDVRLGALARGNTIGGELSVFEVISYTQLLRNDLHAEMTLLLRFLYALDVYICVGHIAASKGFCYARALPAQQNTIKATGLCHPLINGAVRNAVDLNQKHNVVFLTGANMAGKSTLMKTLGISLYLAHLGFPVAAAAFEFSVKEGIYSSINVPDNLNMGYSHFYAEVLRVKAVAEEVSKSKNLLVIFDELFKGTNVKDAFDATLAVTEAFSEYRNCIFIISTHIVEVGEELQKGHGHMQFLYLPTVVKDKVPAYTYKLEAGISSDRQGMMIIEKDGIIEMIRSSSPVGS
jgi:DNA mismatch repair protein MutS